MKHFLAFLIFTTLSFQLFGQETAVEYFRKVSAHYAAVEDMRADVTINWNNQEQRGELLFKSPDKLLINFTTPVSQAISLNDGVLEVYIANQRSSFIQEVETVPGQSAGNTLGLAMLRSNYGVAYEETYDFVPIEPQSSLRVKKLRFTSHTAKEGFREVILSIDRDNIIRQLEGVTVRHEKIQVFFSNVRTNIDLPDGLFNYTSPPVGNKIHNFLFTPE